MTTHPEAHPTEVLAGLVERVTVHNPDSGFCAQGAKATSPRSHVFGHGRVDDLDTGDEGDSPPLVFQRSNYALTEGFGGSTISRLLVRVHRPPYVCYHRTT